MNWPGVAKLSHFQKLICCTCWLPFQTNDLHELHHGRSTDYLFLLKFSEYCWLENSKCFTRIILGYEKIWESILNGFNENGTKKTWFITYIIKCGYFWFGAAKIFFKKLNATVIKNFRENAKAMVTKIFHKHLEQFPQKIIDLEHISILGLPNYHFLLVT